MKSTQSTDTKQRIIDAAMRCAERWGTEKTSLNDIAREAGVTRPTVYSYFSNRDEVLMAAMLQAGYAFAERLLAHVNQFQGDAERVVEALVFALRELPKEPYLTFVTRPDLAYLINAQALTTVDGQQICRSLFETILQSGAIAADDMDEVAEVATRFLLSLLTVEGAQKRDEAQTRSFLQRRLLPALGLSAY